MKDLKIIAMENFNRQLFNRQLREVTKNKMMFLNDHVLQKKFVFRSGGCFK